MIDLEAVHVFSKVAELGSFTRAGEYLRLSKSRVSLRISALESELGTRLLQRTTRAVKLTSDGEQFLTRARRLLNDGEELAAMFQAPSALRGQVRIDLPTVYARNHIIPRLPELFAAHPQLEILLSTTDRRVDLVREGFDCVLRIGALPDSALVGKRLGALHLVNCVSPGYIARHGTPRTLADLSRHLVVHYSLRFGTDEPSFEYRDGSRWREIPMRSAITVNSADAYRAACLAGLGIVQSPRVGVRAELAAGTMIEILPEFAAAPMPVALVHGHGRNLPRRVRVVMAWIAEVVRPTLDEAS